MKKTRFIITFIVLVILAPVFASAQNRYALVIGNANYPRADDRLPNAINDTNDISRELRSLGYEVALKQNLNNVDMVREVDAFIARLKGNRNSEGFFWYAGHAVEISGESFLLPLNVNLESDNIVKVTSYSVMTLTKQLDEVRNKANVLVLDACRVPPAIGGGSRSMGDTSRVMKTVPHIPSDLVVIYSTAPGTTAADGTGKRNSPFAEAFIKNISSSEPLTVIASRVTRETLSLTGQKQRPFISGSITDEYYSLNPAPIPLPPPPSPVYIEPPPPGPEPEPPPLPATPVQQPEEKKGVTQAEWEALLKDW